MRSQVKIYFGTPAKSGTTIVLGALLLLFAWWFTRWAFVDATWTGTASDCRDSAASACWPFLANRAQFILFGFYPADEIGRAIAVSVSFVVCVIVSLAAIFARWKKWLPWLPAVWAIQFVTTLILMSGGVLGMTPVPDRLWSGLPITIILSVGTILLGLPLGTLIALGRRSSNVIVRTVCLCFVEIMRALPIIAVLFIATIIVPLFLPSEISISNLFRALIGLLLVAAAYFSEIVRSGLNGVDRVQYEAAHSLGFSRLQRLRLIILPQAFSLVVPPLVSQSANLLKDTTLIVIISQFDLVGMARLATSDQEWAGFTSEAFFFIGAIYFVMCWSLISFGEQTEKLLTRGRQRTAD